MRERIFIYCSESSDIESLNPPARRAGAAQATRAGTMRADIRAACGLLYSFPFYMVSTVLSRRIMVIVFSFIFSKIIISKLVDHLKKTGSYG